MARNNRGVEDLCGTTSSDVWGESEIEVMTLAEVAELGRECLVDHERELNVRGVKPYDVSAKKFSTRVDCHLGRITPEILRPAIELVLKDLAEVAGGFTMSEPDEWVPSDVPTRTARHGDLRITFSCPFDGDGHVWVSCWYYPAT